MKILRIKLENLSSLYGTHEVDIEKDLKGAPIFLVHGRTGAGKSTLLDAVCLALYGQTPRLEQARSDDDTKVEHVMSRGAAHALAEVEIEIERDGVRKRYVATWRAHRARSKADGEVRPAKRTLREVGRADDLVHSDKPKDYAKVFDEALGGMKVEDFKRCVLLAQGEFAAFLQADDKGRADILERLTDTHRFQEIGSRAAHRMADAKRLYDDAVREAGLAQTRRRSDEERALIEGELAAAEETAKRLAGDERDLAAWQRWWSSETEKTNAIRAAEAREATARADLAAAAPDRERMALHDASEDAFRALVRRDEARALAATSAARVIAREQDVEAKNVAEGVAAERLEHLAAEASGRAKKRDEMRAPIAEARRARVVLAAAESEVKTARASAEIAKEEHAARRSAVVALRGGERTETIRARLDALAAEERRAESEVPADAASRRAELEAAAARSRSVATNAGRAREAVLRWRERALDLATATARSRGLIDAIAAGEAQLEAARAELDALRSRARSKAEDLAHFAWAKRLLAERANLREGEKCPLCGSAEHPAQGLATPDDEVVIRRVTELEPLVAKLGDELRRAEAALRLEEQKLAGVRGEAKAAASALTTADEQTRAAELLATSSSAAIAAPADEAALADLVRRSEAEAARAESARRDLDALVAAHQTALRARVERERALAELTKKEAELARAEVDRSRAEAALETRTEAQKKAKSVADGLLDGRDPVVVEQENEASAARAREAETVARKAHAEVLAASTQAEGSLEAERRESDEHRAAMELAEALLAGALVDLGGIDEAALRARRIDEAALVILRGRSTALARAREASARDVAGALRDHEAHARSQPNPRVEAIDEGATTLALTTAREAREAVLGAIARHRATLEADAEDARRLADLRERVGHLERDANVWKKLNDLVGVGDGKAFQHFAQSINLVELVARANVHLDALSGRYRLEAATRTKSDGTRLGFAVLDKEQAYASRPLTTLSGGETFVVSLALALGLADFFQRRIPIETLLLDEGFGTLDEDTLATVMSALEALRSRGLQVGVISHVEALRQKIPAQVIVERIGASGARVRVVGA